MRRRRPGKLALIRRAAHTYLLVAIKGRLCYICPQTTRRRRCMLNPPPGPWCRVQSTLPTLQSRATSQTSLRDRRYTQRIVSRLSLQTDARSCSCTRERPSGALWQLGHICGRIHNAGSVVISVWTRQALVADSTVLLCTPSFPTALRSCHSKRGEKRRRRDILLFSTVVNEIVVPSASPAPCVAVLDSVLG